PFSLALARLGCFAKGCCHGAPTDVPWAVHYSHLGSKVPLPLLGLGLHPTQLYEAAFLLLLAALLWAALRFNLGRALKAPPGTIATLSIFAYSLFRLVGDSFRGDLARGFWGVSWMSPTQGAALLG